MSVISVRFCWSGKKVIPMPVANRFYEVNIVPEPDFPFGRRGLWIARTWKQLNSSPMTYGQESYIADGMLCVDGDVALDPWDYDVMIDAIADDPESVHVAPIKLWPVSTRADSWVWAHGTDRFRSTQPDEDEKIKLFTFGTTYLPKALIEKCINEGLAGWIYPDVDTMVCMTAMKMPGLRINIVYACQPKHMNY